MLQRFELAGGDGGSCDAATRTPPPQPAAGAVDVAAQLQSRLETALARCMFYRAKLEGLGREDPMHMEDEQKKGGTIPRRPCCPLQCQTTRRGPCP